MVNILRLASFVIFGLIISACSNSYDETAQATKNTSQVKTDETSTASIEQQLAQFQEMKPSLERLVMIETELKALIQEIARMTAEQQKSLEAQKVQQKQSLVVTPEPIPTVPPLVEPSYSNYALQIFTTEDKDSLDKSWKRWSEKHEKRLEGHHPIYQGIKSDTIPLFRVKITNFITKENALDTCKEIKKQGDDCFLTNNTGQRF